jgi:hypothetical protein
MSKPNLPIYLPVFLEPMDPKYYYCERKMQSVGWKCSKAPMRISELVLAKTVYAPNKISTLVKAPLLDPLIPNWLREVWFKHVELPDSVSFDWEDK